MTPRQHEAEFEKLIQKLPPDAQNLARGSRRLILDALPAAFESVWPTQKTASYGTGPKKMSEHFCYLTFAASHVGFGFYDGSDLPDPDGLLEGTGKRMRRTRIAAPADLKNSSLRRLVAAAIAHRARR